MYRLRVIAAPTGTVSSEIPPRGSSFGLEEGETSVGRSGENSVVLPSGRVSKRHCVLVASDGELVLKDRGSSNGTFVNGSLTRQRRLRSGDRIGVGDYVLEVVDSGQDQPLRLESPGGGALSLQDRGRGGGNVLAFQRADKIPVRANLIPAQPAAPRTLKEKISQKFESGIMPIFYEMAHKSELKMVAACIIGVFTLISVFLTLSPLMSTTRSMIIRETQKRAQFMARQLAEINTPAIASRNENKVDVPESMQSGNGVRLAVVTDLDSRIIAPATQQNQYLVKGSEARFAVKMRNEFNSGSEKGKPEISDSGLVIAIEPIRVLNPALGKNITAAMAIVSIDVTVSTPGLSELGVIYSDAFIMVAILSLLLGLVLWRLAMKPLEVLNQDMDKVLQGDLQAVTRNFRWEELNSLLDLINSSLQRVTRSSSESNLEAGPREITAEEFLASIRAMSDVLKAGIVVCGADQRVIYMNNDFETISGIRSDRAMGQTLSDAAVDQGFSQLIADMLMRCEPGGQAVSETCEFGGVPYRAMISAFGPVGSGARCFLVAFVKAEY